MEFVYIGDPNKGGDGPQQVVVMNREGGAFVFEKNGKAIDVGEGHVCGKLKGNSHFRAVEKKPSLGRRPAEPKTETV